MLNRERGRKKERILGQIRGGEACEWRGGGEGLALNYAAYAKRELSWQVIRETRESCISQRI